MKLQQLRFLTAVVDNGLNITIAADALYTSQPGVSKQIRLLEDELGLKLFVRRGKRIEALTPAGEQVVEHAGKVLNEVNRIRTLSEELRGEVKGSLSLATTQTQARYVLPPALGAFRQRFPDISVALHQGTTEQIARMISERQADFAMVTGSSELFADMVQLPVYCWDRVIIVPRDHFLAQLDHALDLATLARHPLITYLFSDRPESSLMAAFANQDLTPSIAFTARDSDVIKTYVRSGLGVGIVASMAIEDGVDDDLVAINANHLFSRLTTWVGYRRDLLLTSYHGEFLRLLAPHLQSELIDDALQARPLPPLEQISSNIDLPLRNGRASKAATP